MEIELSAETTRGRVHRAMGIKGAKGPSQRAEREHAFASAEQRGDEPQAPTWLIRAMSPLM
jgi:hypothetical protein